MLDMRLLYAETKFWIACEQPLLSAPIVNVTCAPFVAFARFSVTPEIAPLTLFVELCMGTPSTVADAFCPAFAVKDRLEGAFEIEIVPALPDVLLTRARREPVASVITLAVTP